MHKEVASEPPTEQTPEDLLVDPTVNTSLGQLPSLCPQVEGDRSFLNEIKIGYTKDPLCSKVLDNVEHYKTFEVQDGLIYYIYTQSLGRIRAMYTICRPKKVTTN